MQKRYRKWLWLVLALLVVLGGIGGLVHQRLASTSHKTVKVGLVGTDSLPVWKNVASRLKKDGITLKFVIFNDYVQPDVALKDGKIDLHSCLTRYYFESYNKKENAHLVSIGNTVISPLGLYSKNYKLIKDLPDGATIAIPNEPTTLGRGLNLLQSAGLIKVKKTAASSRR